MESEQDFISYKKILLFGDKGTGKSTLSNSLKNKGRKRENSKILFQSDPTIDS